MVSTSLQHQQNALCEDDTILRVTVLACQHSQLMLQYATHAQAVQLCRQEYRTWIGRLYQLLEADLYQAARRMHPIPGSDEATLAFSLFSSLFSILPALALDQETNIRSLLIKSAVSPAAACIPATPGAQQRAEPDYQGLPPESTSMQNSAIGAVSPEAIDQEGTTLAGESSCLKDRARSAFNQHTRLMLDRLSHELHECERLFQELIMLRNETRILSMERHAWP